jgi:hypothetical protein
MARARNIKPGFFSNDDLAECDPLTRLFFAGLWCWADRAGRIEERPKKLRAEIMPYDRCDIGRMLDQLAAKNFVVRYEVDGRKYIQILNFPKHQNPHVNEAASIIPPPPTESVVAISTVQVPEQSGTATANVGTNRADSLNPHTDSLSLDSSKDAATKPRSHSKPVTVDLLEIPPVLNTPEGRAAIEEWLSYKRSKGQAYKSPSHFNNKLVDFPTAAALVAAVKHSTGSNYDGLYSPGVSNGTQRKLNIGAGQKHDDGKPVQDGIL